MQYCSLAIIAASPSWRIESFLSDEAMGRDIMFDGEGWYSLDDQNIYRKGIQPTYSYSRIRIEPCARS